MGENIIAVLDHINICLLYGNRITKYWPIKQAKNHI